MNKTMIVYLDDKGNEVPEEQATKINIVEYDKKGNRVKETYMMKSRELTAEEAKKYWEPSFEDLVKNDDREYLFTGELKLTKRVK